MKSAGSRRASAGFTLLEILVALTLIGLLAGALVPTVVSQLGKGEVNRVVEDVSVLNTGVKSFRVDVGRFPGDIEDLTAAVGSTDADVNGTAYPAGLAAKWAGPYLEQGGLNAGNTISTGMGGDVLNAFGKTTWGGQSFLTVKVTGVSQSDAEAVSSALDGDDVITATSETAGQVRWKAGDGSTTPDTLLFLATPVN